MDTNPNAKGEGGSPKYWLSLEQWRQDPEFMELAEKEFRSSPLIEADGQGGWARREFLKLMGASLALTSFGCMRRPAQMIVPYAKKPREVIHGLANYYASTFVDGQEAFGILVTTRDGRPIKIEGNPDHPATSGGMSARAHAHILSLYDPDRLTGPRRNLHNDKRTNRETVTVRYEDLDEAVVDQLKKGGVAVLAGSDGSPSLKAMVDEFAAAAGAKVYRWDALNAEAQVVAQKLCYGREVVPSLRLDKARLIVSFNGDFLGTEGAVTANTKTFAAGRKVGKEMNKLVMFESLMSLTGSNADERFRVAAGGELDAAMGILHHILVTKKFSGYANDGAVLKALEPFADAEIRLGLKAGTLARIGDELIEKAGQSLVVAGHRGGEAALATLIAVNFMNSVLGNDGVTVDFRRPLVTGVDGRDSDLLALVENLKAKKVKTLIVHGCNPAYAAASSGFVEAAKNAEMIIYTGDRMDETAVIADYLAPDHHPLEGWSDLESSPGVFAIQQPTIEPLYQTRGFGDSLLVWTKGLGGGGAAGNWYEYVRNYWRTKIYAANRSVVPANKDFDDFWLAVLHVGVFDTSREATSTGARGFQTAALAKIQRFERPTGFTLELYPTVGLRDGSLANVSWLQEFPDPVTKICWDNYLTMSPADANREKIRQGDVVKIQVGGNAVEVPVHVQPGQADGVLGLAVGYGRTRAGKVANGVGVNAYQLVQWTGTMAMAGGLKADVVKTKRTYQLAATQDHHTMEGRQIVVEATLAQAMKDPGANIHRHKLMTMWSEHQYPNNKWGMVIDLNSCTGCGSCVIACQSENNIPTVGKRHVLNSREMHWIRIDRYYVGDPNDPAIVHQPVVCMHCDNAPCETVCPVMATVHSDEGTNDMIYNRCVGTRYCSNNCPYKVRRFNWFNFVKGIEKPLNYAMNPDVTVRARGVMEKCTFCIHRIRSVKQKARVEERPLRDGDIKTACQQSCPAEAIIFGDLNDKESRVSKAFSAANSYALLEELNAKPAVRYQSKIRNTEELKGGGGHGGGHGSGDHGHANGGHS